MTGRCPWALTPGEMQDYHDAEWGRSEATEHDNQREGSTELTP